MSEVHKAAVLLLSLPEEEAGTLLSRLDPHQVERVSIEIAKLRGVGSDEQEAVIREFAETSPGFSGDGGGLELAKSLVRRALGNEAGHAIDNIRQSIESMPFGFLRNVDSHNVLTYIIDEHPQTIALILSHLPPVFGAEILGRLPEARQLAVVKRMAQMGQTNPDIIREVESQLERRMSSLVSQQFEHAGGVASVANILNVCDRATERALLEKLAQEDQELVDDIRRRMFVFEDIAKFSDKDMQVVLRNVDTSQWSMALKGASEELREKVLKNMSQRAADLLREEMEYLGAVKRSAVEAKQQEIVDAVRQLEDQGEIDTSPSGDDEQLLM